MKYFFRIALLLLILSASDSRAVDRLPISFTASTEGYFGLSPAGWHLTVNSAGRAQLSVASYNPKPFVREFDVSEGQLDKLASLVIEENFFKLKEDYGELAVDGSTDKMTITLGDKTHTVSIHSLYNWIQNSPSKLIEPARAIRIFRFIRRLFEEKNAVDGTRYDERILEAARRAEQGAVAPAEQNSSISKFVIRKNLSDDNATVISPEKQSIGIVFPADSKFLLIVPPNFPYSVGSEYAPRTSDLAWITISNKSGFIDCVVVAQNKTISFAPPDVINLLKKHEIEGRQAVSFY